jgi:hypothetical protein
MKPSKVMSSDMIAGYAFKSVEYSTAKATDAFRNIPDEGVVGEVVIPKVWVGGVPLANIELTPFRLKMEDVMQTLTDAFVAMYGEQLLLVANWEEYHYQTAHIVIRYRVMKHAPKKMTVAEIEKKLGYKIEIVSDK